MKTSARFQNISPDKKRNIIAIVGSFFSTLIYSVAVIWLIHLGKFYAGGVTGIAQLIVRTIERLFNRSDVSMSIFIAIFNVPLFILGWRYVSRKFAYISVMSVVLQIVFTYILEQGWIMKNPFTGLENDRLLLAIFGGSATGLGCGLTLRFGASTGGMDIAAQFVALKTKVPFVVFSFAVDILVIVMGAIVARDINTAIFTIVRLVIHLVVLNKVHTIYQYVNVKIITSCKDEIIEELLKKYNHGITVYEVVGAYTNEIKYVLETVVLSYEASEYYAIARKIDQKVFITYSNITRIDGNYKKKTIA